MTDLDYLANYALILERERDHCIRMIARSRLNFRRLWISFLAVSVVAVGALISLVLLALGY